MEFFGINLVIPNASVKSGSGMPPFHVTTEVTGCGRCRIDIALVANVAIICNRVGVVPMVVAPYTNHFN